MWLNSVGVPKEIKDSEGRVGLRPGDVEYIVQRISRPVFVESGAGLKSGFSDEEYKKAGACICDNVYEEASLIVKVKEPIGNELQYLNDTHKTFFCYFHFASTKLEYSDATMYPYEELQLEDGSLPLLEPMSEIAGKLSIHKGAELLMSERGLLMGGATGVDAANVLIIGGGIVGENAATVALGMGANVTILDRDVKRIKKLNELFPKSRNLFSNEQAIYKEVGMADLIIGAVHSKGKETSKLINDSHFEKMKTNSVFIDVAIDQGGCTVASKPTTHSSPIFTYKNTTMYCVANMPGAVPRTSTEALCNVTSKYLFELLQTESLKRYYD